MTRRCNNEHKTPGFVTEGLSEWHFRLGGVPCAAERPSCVSYPSTLQPAARCMTGEDDRWVEQKLIYELEGERERRERTTATTKLLAELPQLFIGV